MAESKFELEELYGSLWHETNCTVVRKGKIKINGQDRYASILKYTNPQGEDKYELAFSAGLLRINDDKRSEKSPDLYGRITFDTVPYKFGGWRNITTSGSEWTKVQLEIKEDEEQTKDNPVSETDDANNDAPF